jgi:hypothetical protein
MISQLEIARGLEDRVIAPTAPTDDHQPIACLRPPVDADPQRLQQGR